MTAREPLGARALEFRDPAGAAALANALRQLAREVGRPVSLMHVCGSHEQAIARFGLRAMLPPDVEVMMGPGCPVCVTDAAEIDDAVALARQGVIVATYGDILRVAGSATSLADARAEGAAVHVVYSVVQAVTLARTRPGREVVFFATGFETTAVATAAAVARRRAAELLDPAGAQVHPAGHGGRRRDPRHAGRGLPRRGARRDDHRLGDLRAVRRAPPHCRSSSPASSRWTSSRRSCSCSRWCATAHRAWSTCIRAASRARGTGARSPGSVASSSAPRGPWRGIARVPAATCGCATSGRTWTRGGVSGCRRARVAREDAADRDCICGPIMSGLATPADCTLFGGACVPDSPVGACMVSSEGICRIWHQYGGRPEAAAVGSPAARAGG
jgi:hydrogenase expression/formation protein HypD